MKLSLLDWRERTEDEGWWWWWWRRGDDEAELATGGPPEAEAAEAPAAALEIDGPAPHGVEHDDALENSIIFHGLSDNMTPSGIVKCVIES